MNTNFTKVNIVCGFILSNGEYMYNLYQPFFNKNINVFHPEHESEIVLFKLTDLIDKCNTTLPYLYSKILSNIDIFKNEVYQAENILNKNDEYYDSEYLANLRTHSFFLTFKACENLYELCKSKFNSKDKKRKISEKTIHPNKLRKLVLNKKEKSSSNSNNKLNNEEYLLNIIKQKEEIIENKDKQIQELKTMCKNYIQDMSIFIQYTYNNHCEQYLHHLTNMNALYKKFYEPVLNLDKNII